MGEYDVAISYAREDLEYAASLYRRLSGFVKVFFDLACNPPSVGAHAALQATFDGSDLITVVVGPAYSGKPFPEWELSSVTARLKAEKFNRVQLIKAPNADFPAQLAATGTLVITAGHVTLPPTGWHLELDRAVQLILEKLKSLSRRRTGPTRRPFSLSRYADTVDEPEVPPAVRRHLARLTPLFKKAPAVKRIAAKDLLTYARNGALGCASLRGRIEQMQRAADLVKALRALVHACSFETGETPEELEQNARTAVHQMLDVLRSTEENQAELVAGQGWLVPDYAQLITRFKHYLIRHLEKAGSLLPAHSKLVKGLWDLLCRAHFAAGPGMRIDMIRSLCADAETVAESIHAHFMAKREATAQGANNKQVRKKRGGKKQVGKQDFSPEAMGFLDVEESIKRTNTWRGYEYE